MGLHYVPFLQILLSACLTSLTLFLILWGWIDIRMFEHSALKQKGEYSLYLNFTWFEVNHELWGIKHRT